jgi:hypothetical protein
MNDREDYMDARGSDPKGWVTSSAIVFTHFVIASI